MAEVKKKKTIKKKAAKKKPKKVESLNKKSKSGKGSGRGGARKGAGRPKGKMEEATLMRMRAEAQMRKIIAANASELVTELMKLAIGYPHLYQLRSRTNKDGKKLSPESILIRDDKLLVEVIADPKKYSGKYYVSIDAPKQSAIDSLLDRGFGKAKQSVDIDLEANVKHDSSEDAKRQEELLNVLRQGTKKT